MCLAISNNLLLVLQDAPKRIFSTNSRSSGQPKNDAKTIFPTLHPLSTVIFATETVLAFVLLRDSRFNFHCYTKREATQTPKSTRKYAATSRDFLCERLQSAFTLANHFAESPSRLKTDESNRMRFERSSNNMAETARVSLSSDSNLTNGARSENSDWLFHEK